MENNRKILWIIAAAVLVVCACILAACTGTQYFSACSRNTRMLERKLAEAAEKGRTDGAVSELFSLDYDALYVFEPYKAVSVMEKELGFKTGILREGDSENCMNYLFVKENEPAAYLYGRPGDIGYCINLKPGKYISADVQDMSYETAVRRTGSSAEGESKYADYNFYYRDEISVEGETEVVVEQSGRAVQEVPVGEEISVDLDGDGLDSVSYSLAASVSGNGGKSCEIEQFIINGKDFKSALAKMGAELDTPNQVHYYIIDLSASDDYKEIALLNDGDSPVTYFFRYQNGKLSLLGSISDFPGSDTCHFQNEGKEKGEIIASFKLSILQDWNAEGYWKLNENSRLTFQPQSVYYLNNPYEADLLCELPVYKERDRDGESFLMEPGKIELSATDNKNWVQIEDRSGNQGWFYVEDYDTIADTGLKAAEVFQGLKQDGKLTNE